MSAMCNHADVRACAATSGHSWVCGPTAAGAQVDVHGQC